MSTWKNGVKIRPESGCGLPTILRYGEIQGIIVENGKVSGFEHQGCSLEDYKKTGDEGCPRAASDFYLYVDATNSDSGWDHEHYLRAGPVTYCTSISHLAHYTCITCTMGDDGKVTNCGGRFTREK